MGVNIWVNRRQLYLDIYTRGERRREKLEGLALIGDRATDKETMRLAEVAKAKRAQQVFSAEWELVDTVAGDQTLYAYTEKRAEKAGRSRRESIQSALKHLKEFPGGATVRVSRITEKWLENFQDYLLRDRKLSAASAATYAGIIRVALKQAVKDRILLRNPAVGTAYIKVPEADRVWLNAEELRRLAGTPLEGVAGGEIRRAFVFACYTGLRISDIKSLTWGDIEYSPLQLIKRMQKTESKVYVPLNGTAWGIINDGALHDHRASVFPLLAGIDHCYYARLNQWARAAGISKRIGWHTARHTFAVLSLEAGAEIYTVSKLLGHKDLKTTQIYAKATDKLKRAAVDALPMVELKG
jgi:integrase